MRVVLSNPEGDYLMTPNPPSSCDRGIENETGDSATAASTLHSTLIL